MTRAVAICSQKGGVGKTSLTQNLGAELVAAGQRVLLVDFDPQSNLTTGWGIDPDEDRSTVYTAMLNPDDTASCIVNLRPQLDLIPANLDLAGAELEFLMGVGRDTRLQRALAPVADRYDFILIDGPPSLGFFTINAMVAATELFIPLQAQVYAYKAVDQMLRIFEQVQQVNPALRLSAIILTMYDTRNSLTFSVEEIVRERFRELVLQTTIPVNVRIAEAPLDGVPVREYEPGSRGAEAYKAAAQEILDRG